MDDADGDFLGQSWISRLESIASLLAGTVPEVGGLLQFIIYTFWPGQEQPSIWDQIKSQVEAVVDAAVLAEDLHDQEALINNIHYELQQYTKSADPTAKGIWLIQLLGHTNQLRENLMTPSTDKATSEHDIQMIPVTVTAAHLELAVLRERCLHGLKYFPKDDPTQYAADLQDIYETYRQYFIDVLPRWRSWREGQVSVTTGNQTVTLNDTFTTEKWSIGSTDDTGTAQRTAAVAAAVKQRVYTQATAQIASALAGTYTLHRYLPGHEKDQPVVQAGLDYFVVGPSSVTTLGISYDGPLDYAVSDRPGRMSKVWLSSGNSIDGLQFTYGDRAGALIGSAAGADVEIPVGQDQHFIGLYMAFSQGIMYLLKVLQSASESALYGNTGWQGKAIAASAGPAYEMVGGQFTEGSGPSNTRGTAVVGLDIAYSGLIGCPYPGVWWNSLAGNATGDISVGPDGTVWVIDESGEIYVFVDDAPIKVAGNAHAISVGPDGIPFVIADDKTVQKRASKDSAGDGDWHVIEGFTGLALALAAGGDGSLWGVNEQGAISRWYDGAWMPIDSPSKARTLSISVGSDGMPWATVNGGGIYRRTGEAGTGGQWLPQPGAAVDIAVASDADGKVWCLSEGGDIWYWYVDNWQQVGGTASRIATGPDGSPVVLQSTGTIVKRYSS